MRQNLKLISFIALISIFPLDCEASLKRLQSSLPTCPAILKKNSSIASDTATITALIAILMIPAFFEAARERGNPLPQTR